MAKSSLSISAKIEILAPPHIVRSIFVDFTQYPNWHPAWTIENSNKSASQTKVEAGDRLKVKMGGMAFNPLVIENSAECFSWEGSLFGLLVGKHDFCFSPSEENPGCTTFIQKEDFRGPLTIFFWPWSKKDMSSASWNEFNESLKKEAERVARKS